MAQFSQRYVAGRRLAAIMSGSRTTSGTGRNTERPPIHRGHVRKVCGIRTCPALPPGDRQVTWDAREVSEDRNAYLESMLIGGRERVVVTVVRYDERWPQRFQEVAGHVRRVLVSCAGSSLQKSPE